MTPFYWFIALTLAVVLLAFLFLRRTFAEISNSIAQHAKFYTVAWVIGTALVTSNMLTSFVETFRDITAEQAAAFTWWQWTCKFFAPIIIGLGTIIAFFNRAIERAGAAKSAAEGPTPIP